MDFQLYFSDLKYFINKLSFGLKISQKSKLKTIRSE